MAWEVDESDVSCCEFDGGLLVGLFYGAYGTCILPLIFVSNARIVQFANPPLPLSPANRRLQHLPLQNNLRYKLHELRDRKILPRILQRAELLDRSSEYRRLSPAVRLLYGTVWLAEVSAALGRE